MLKIRTLLIISLIAVIGMAGCELDSVNQANNDEADIFTINIDSDDVKISVPLYIEIPVHKAEDPGWSLKVEVTGSDRTLYTFSFNEPYFLQGVYGGTYFEAYKVKSAYLPRAGKPILRGRLYLIAKMKSDGSTITIPIIIHLC